MKNKINNNQVQLTGLISSSFKYSHMNLGEKFYTFNLLTKRLSGAYDRVPITISENMVDTTQNCTGEYVTISGQYRSYNLNDGNRRRLILSVYATSITFLKNYFDEEHSNQIVLNGFLCRNPVYRETPRGRKITDLLLAVNHLSGQTDYIPCIAWGNNANFINQYGVGTNVSVYGRIQSREYTKTNDSGIKEIKTAYEVSVSEIIVFEEKEN